MILEVQCSMPKRTCTLKYTIPPEDFEVALKDSSAAHADAKGLCPSFADTQSGTEEAIRLYGIAKMMNEVLYGQCGSNCRTAPTTKIHSQ